MSKNIMAIAIVVVVVAAGVAVFLVMQNNKSESNTESNTNEGNTTSQNNVTKSVEITNMTFSPATITVKVGDTVTWTNNEASLHTVTAKDGSFDSSSLSKGKTFSFTFTEKGEFTYNCTFHPNMVGKVIVE